MISRLKYNNEESSKTNKKIQEQLFNTSSQELNDIITSPDITTSKNEDFPVSSTNDHITQIIMVFNNMITE